MAEKAEIKNSGMEDLWRRYRLKKETAVRDRIVEQYLYLVNIIAGRVAVNLPAYADREELVSCGFFGLLDAVERYDPDMGNKFETYAGIRIKGAILDSLRDRDWIPSSVRQKIRTYERTMYRLEGKLGRPATDSEVADAMKMTMEEYYSLLGKINTSTVIPLEEYMKSERVQNSFREVSHHIEAQEVKECLANAIAKLPEKEKLVVSLYYYEELTLKEISLILNLTEARISQLHTKAVFRLRGALARIKSSLI